MTQPPSLEGCVILVVEDEFLVGEALAELLQDAGARVHGPFGWVDEALAFVEANDVPIDCAILDVNLHGEKSYPIADALVARDVPVVFATGYSADALDEPYRVHPRCEKPVDGRALLAMLPLRPPSSE